MSANGLVQSRGLPGRNTARLSRGATRRSNKHIATTTPVNYLVITNNERQAETDAAVAGLADAIGTAVRRQVIINSEMEAKGYRLLSIQEVSRLRTDDAPRVGSDPSYSTDNAPIYPP